MTDKNTNNILQDRTWRDARTDLFAVLIVLLALVLRLYRLGSEGLWIDEGFSLRDAAHLSFLHETRPLYFAFLSWWMSLGAQSEFWLRLPSALFGAASVGVLYLTGRRLLGSTTAVIASLFMAVSVLQVNHSREVRMYSLMALLAMLATYFLILALERRKPGYIIGYLLLAAAGLLTQPLTVLILAAHGLFLLLYARTYRPYSYIIMAGQVAIALAWVPWMMNNMSVAPEYAQGITSVLDRPSPMGAIYMFGKFFLWKWHHPSKLMLGVALTFSAVVFAVSLYGLRGFRRPDVHRAFIWIWLAVPMLGMAIASFAMGNMWMVHYLIAASPACYLLLAEGIRSMGNKRLGAAAVLAVVAVTSGRLWMYMSKPSRPEWTRAVSYIERNERPGDVIGIYYGGNRWTFGYYYRGQSRWAPLGTDEIDSSHWRGWSDARVARMLGTYPNTGKRLWLVLSNHEMAGGPAISSYIGRRYQVIDHQYYNQLEIMLVKGRGRMSAHI